jgi:hypothetical protein
MVILLDLFVGAFWGAFLGWYLCAQFYALSNSDRTSSRLEWLFAAFPDGFWPASALLALIGAMIGVAVVAAKLFLIPLMRHLGIQ